jgi:hypothetical protein
VLTGSGRLGVALALALSVALSLTGCGSHAGTTPQALPLLVPVLAPTPSVSPATPGPATTSKSAPSGRAARQLAAGAALVRHYYGLLEALPTSMHPAEFGALMTKNCKCRKFVRTLRHLQTKHEHFFGAAKVLRITPVIDDPHTTQVLVTYNAGPGGIKGPTGRTVSRGKPLNLASLNYILVRAGPRWLIARIDIINYGTT